MSEAKRVLEAIKASGVTRVAVVDDAFDPPDIPQNQLGELLDYLMADNADQVRKEAAIEEEAWQAAIEGLNAGSDDAAFELLRKLYAAYLQTFDSKFDPMGQFATLKGPNLAYVRPLLNLIRQAEPNITVTTYGTQMDAVEEQDGPHVVFVDLYLDPSISPTDAPELAHARSAAEASIARIEPLLKLSPSVILMSSHSGTTQAKEYRSKIGGANRVYASRFGFVEKTKFTEGEGDIAVDPETSDVLLDLFQTYNFGRGLHTTLDSWVKSAKAAVENLEDEIDGLELADLAYLVRFRLAAEGQSLPDYLEWLLGECLIDELGRQLDKAVPVTHFTEEAKRVEGAFNGPTEKVASLYHRVRFENKRVRPREHFRLGDLYLHKQKKGADRLIAIMNPDCDLVKRPGQSKPAAHAVLTLQGTLQQFNAPSTSVGDFIVIDDKPQNIKWNYRAIETMPFDNVMAQAGQDHGDYRYLGALRPLYAQEIQANMLNRLGRVGVAVAPALAFASEVTVHYAVKGGRLMTLKVDCKDVPAYVVPARQSDQEGLAVFTRPFVRQLLIALGDIDQTTLAAEAVRHLNAILGDAGRAKLSSLTADGLELEQSAGNGVLLTGKRPKMNGQYWCCIAVAIKLDVEPSEPEKTVPVAPEVITLNPAEAVAPGAEPSVATQDAVAEEQDIVAPGGEPSEATKTVPVAPEVITLNPAEAVAPSPEPSVTAQDVVADEQAMVVPVRQCATK